MYGQQFRLLLQEGSLAQTALMSGLEFLAKSDYDKKGSYYLAFFQLSIGFERLMKIAFILDFRINNTLRNPSDKELRGLGHNLLRAYEACEQIATSRGRNPADWHHAGSLEYELVSFLSEFAEGSRYYNLDQLAGRQRHDDPLVRWHGVHKEVAQHYVSWARQEAINNKAIAHCDRHKLYGFEQGVDGEFRTQVDMTFLHELLRVSRGYCVWTVIRILRPFHGLLRALCDAAQAAERQLAPESSTVPFMYEFFPFCLCDRQTSTTRKKWIGIY